ncbi:cysteine protease StiP domain-containing protein [Candidatus Magnetobacterium casense]|uniref:Cysteine protease StiP N-terminal domain-containing protein n=1 Tax=Candidatus Magnetobacterium casense TaxID=1455061 RepID=A0ABS6RYS1_9BACT|nr:hypothetical protein [Candidatus Magnetobacterium casensis]
MKKSSREIFDRDVAHYAISIIRDRGIDENALRHILCAHAGAEIVFSVDMPDISHILMLAAERGVEVEAVADMPCNATAVIA